MSGEIRKTEPGTLKAGEMACVVCQSPMGLAASMTDPMTSDRVRLFECPKCRNTVSVLSEFGKEAVVAILQPGNFCGEECLTGHKLRMSTVKALTECTLIKMTKASTMRALHEDHAFSELFTVYLMERNVRIQADLVDQLLNSTEKRLARLLLILANYGKEDRPEPIIPKLSQETLAEMVGTSRTHVNHFMNKFRDLGLIEYNGDIKVNRSLLNMLLHEKPQIAVESGSDTE
jgi:CRP/FNR family transcriptional regulator, cyclic AMP receptor protein